MKDFALFVVCATVFLVAGVRGQERLYTFDGDSNADSFGSSVSGAGDVNRDGFDDLIVGAPRDDNNGADSGSARVFSGVDGSILYTFEGDSAGDWFGESVSGAGDVNADGFEDVIVGAPEDSNAGYLYGSAQVFSGVDGSLLYRFDGDSQIFFGWAVSGAGDVNNDGFGDLIVGTPWANNKGTNSGTARVFSGADGSILYIFDGDSPYDLFGESVSGAGDVNDDGFDDLIVGAPDDDNTARESGSARVFSGFDGSILYTFNGDSFRDWLGGSVSGAGDVNGDGFSDVIAGSQGDDNNGYNSGSARVFSGADGSILHTFNGDSVDNRFGSSVDGAGDVNGDGYHDLLVGAAYDDNNEDDSGIARLYSGRNGSILYTFNGDARDDWLGSSVSGAGDVNKDGFSDLIVGIPGDDNNGPLSGSTQVFSGKILLAASRVTLSSSAGGQVRYMMDFPVSEAGVNYVLLASGTQEAPLHVQATSIPLGDDPLFQLMRTLNAPPVFSNAYGKLNSLGDATATLRVPPGAAAAYVGRSLYFAAASYATGPFSLRMSTGAVSLTIEP